MEPFGQWGIEPVPAAARRFGFWDYVVLWGDLGIGLLVLLAGSFLVPGLSLGHALGAIVLGSLIGVALLALAGIAGSQTGVPTMVVLRPVLGIRGSYLSTAVNVVQLLGWAVFELVIMGHAANAVSKQLFGGGTPTPSGLRSGACWSSAWLSGGRWPWCASGSGASRCGSCSSRRSG